MRTWIRVLSVALFATACRQAPHETLPLHVEYAGCRMSASGTHCVPDGPITLWVRAPTGATIEIDAHTRSETAAPVAIAGGLRYEIVPSPLGRRIGVRALLGAASSEWRLELGAADETDALAQARESFGAGEFRDARERVESLLSGGSSAQRGEALGLLARVALREGNQQEAQEHLRAAVDAHSAAGERAAVVNDSTMLVFLLLEQLRFSEARAMLDSLVPAADDPAESRYLTAYYRGRLARETGDAREALRRYEDAIAQAERVGLTAWHRAAQEELATLLQPLGRRGEADAIYAELLRDAPPDLDDCERAQLFTNAGWNRLSALEADEPADDPTPMLREALSLYERGCGARIDRQINARLNLALAALHAGNVNDAATELASAEPEREQASAGQILWWRDLEARIALAEGHAEVALRAYDDLERLAAASAAPEAQWRAVVGRARASAALGARDDALAAYARADELLDEESLQVPMQEGRETFAAAREGATRQHVALLLDAGRDDEALAVVRSARSRALRALQRQDRLAQLSSEERAHWDDAIAAYLAQRAALNEAAAEDWHRSADQLRELELQRASKRAALARALDDAFVVLDREAGEARRLPELAPGELMLAYHPLPTGWAAFAHTSGATRAVTLACVDAADEARALASCLLEPFHAEIAQAKEIRVLPYGVLRGVDFHALPFAGDVLVATAPVVYALDLPGTAERTSLTNRALVVADPRGNLPAARREGERVAAALNARGAWAPETLAGRAALASELRRRLAEVDLFHYAGHAVFGGESGWDSVLPLADSSDLTLGDILALAHAPRWVVLSGCETGRSGAASPAESLGLAQAFLAAGSTSVLAAVRPVADETAAELVDAFYDAWSDSTPASAALRAAQLAVRVRDPAADWASFRILEH